MLNLTYNVEEFNTFIDIFFGDIKKCMPSVKKKYDVDEETESFISDAAGSTTPLLCDGNIGWLVLIDDINYDERDIDKILTHEMIHVIFGIATKAGIKLGDDSEEFYTYFITHYIDKVRYDYKKKMRKSCTK